MGVASGLEGAGEIRKQEETMLVDGAKRTFLSTKAPYRDHEGRGTGVIGVASDITELKNAESADLQTDFDIHDPAFAAERDAMLAELEATLLEVRYGSQGHYLGPEGLAERIEHLQTFRL